MENNNDKESIMDENYCMTTAEVAEYLQISERTLKTMRVEKSGPSFFRFGRIIRYRLSDVIAWRDSKICVSEKLPKKQSALAG